MDSKQLQINWKKIAIFLGPILGVVVGFYLNQIYYNENQLTSQQWSLKKELVKQQYPYLIRLLRMTDISKNMTTLTPKQVYVDKETEKVLYEVEATYKIPSFCLEGGLKEEWHTIGKEIYNNRHQLSRELFYRFKAVYDFRFKYGFPKSTKLKDLKKSYWVKEKIQKKWKKLNHELFVTTQDYIRMKQ